MANEALRLIGTSADAGADPATDELNVRGVWRALMRRKLALLTPVVLIPLAVFLWAKQQPPLYQAEALLHVRDREAQVVQVEGVVEELVADEATIESEIEYLNSPAFSRRVVEKLGLMEDLEFAPWLRNDEPSVIETVFELLNPMTYIPDEWWGAESEGVLPATDPEAKRLNLVAGIVSGRLTAEQVGRSYVISLTFLSEDPAKAARIANVMAEEYLASQVEAKYAAAERATQFLSEKINELRQEVLEAEAKLVEYRTSNNLVSTESDNPLTLQFFQLNNQLALAQAEPAGAEARLSRAKSVLESSGAQTAAAVLTSPLMDSLRSQETELLRE